MANLGKGLYDLARSLDAIAGITRRSEGTAPKPRQKLRRPSNSPVRRRNTPANSPDRHKPGPTKYALNRQQTTQLVDKTFGAFAPFVRMIAWGMGIDLHKAIQRGGKQLDKINQALKGMGFTPPSGAVGPPPGEPPDIIEPGQPTGPPRPPDLPPTGEGPPAPGPEPPEPPEPPLTIPTVMDPRVSTGREPPREAEVEWSEQVLVESSNVYSFQYHFPSSTLRVTYRAPILAKGKVAMGKGGLRGIKAGSKGAAFRGKSKSPGASYNYFSVPVQVYRKLIRAPSAGESVWTNLRIRGTIYGHQYRYALTGPALVAGIDGKMGAYVPRKASKRGYIARRFREVGGRRYIESSLPPQTVDRGQPDRGTPDRGAPNRGR